MRKDTKGRKNPNWKGGRVEKDGYIMIHMPEHLNANERGYVYEHRFVMSGLINRALYPDEDVHHIDEDRSNNDPSNLMLDRHSSHLAMHSSGAKKFTPKQLLLIKKGYVKGMSAAAISKKCNCSSCTVLYWLKKMGVEIRGPGFYSQKRTGRSKLTKDQWQNLYEEYASGVHTIKRLSEKYGISQAMIPRGLKAHGYEIRSPGGGRGPKKVLSV